MGKNNVEERERARRKSENVYLYPYFVVAREIFKRFLINQSGGYVAVGGARK